MKFRGLLFANLFRKKLRFLLTIGSFAVALFLFGILAVVKGAFTGNAQVAGVDRLVAINRVSIIQTMPLSYADRILRIPGVKYITHDNWFGGVYQDERNFFPQFAIDPENQRKVFTELAVPDDQWENFVKDQQGAIAGASLAKRFGWKVGDRIPIRNTIYPIPNNNLQFNLEGIYRGTREGDDETQFWFQYKYLEENLPDRIKGQVGWYTVKIDNPDDAARIAKTIDEMFANSPYETKTETEKAFATSFAKQMGNIEFLILTIGGVVFFTLLLVTGNTMAISVRERTGELAVLKAIGYSDRFVLFFVMAESLAIAVAGGLIGLGLAKLFTMAKTPLSSVLAVMVLPPASLMLGVACALLIGIVAGLLPALGAMRLRVVDALRRV
jgi:putative ABC transport system permease protein